MNAFRGRSDLDQPPRVFVALRQEELHVLHHAPQQAAESQVAGQRTVRDAGIHHGDGRAGSPRQLQQVGPEFALRQNQQLRPQRLQIGAHRERQIERNIEDVVLAESLARQLLSRVGGGRDDDAPARQLRFQFLDHARDRQHLANRDGVDPDGIDCDLIEEPVRHRAQPLAHPVRYLPWRSISSSHHGALMTSASSSRML